MAIGRDASMRAIFEFDCAVRACTWQVGANREKQLTFFSTEMDVLASNDLGTAILSAIPSVCRSMIL